MRASANSVRFSEQFFCVGDHEYVGCQLLHELTARQLELDFTYKAKPARGPPDFVDGEPYTAIVLNKMRGRQNLHDQTSRLMGFGEHVVADLNPNGKRAKILVNNGCR